MRGTVARAKGREQRTHARLLFARSFWRLPNDVFLSEARENDTRCGAEAAAAALKCRAVLKGPDTEVQPFDVAKDGLEDGLQLPQKACTM